VLVLLRYWHNGTWSVLFLLQLHFRYEALTRHNMCTMPEKFPIVLFVLQPSLNFASLQKERPWAAWDGRVHSGKCIQSGAVAFSSCRLRVPRVGWAAAKLVPSSTVWIFCLLFHWNLQTHYENLTSSQLSRRAVNEQEQTPWSESASDRHLSANLVPSFADRGCHIVIVTDTYGRILGFLYRNHYFFFQVAPQLYSGGWVNPVPDPLLLTKSGIAGTRDPDLDL
jgi:hypothetical protein